MKHHSLWFMTALGLLACGTDDSVSSVVGLPSTAGAGGNNTPAAQGGAQGGGTQGGILPPVTGTGTGAGAPSTPSSSNQGTVCEVQSVDSGRVAPDMLIVLDRSGSMRMGDVNRWDPSVSALKTITSSFGDSINFGLMAFPGRSATTPTSTQNCAAITNIVDQVACWTSQRAGSVGAIDTCAAGSVDVPIAPSNGAAIASALSGMAPDGATPTAATLKAAHDALGSVMVALDDVTRPKYVLLVTDGAPNCSDPASLGRGFDQQALDQSVAEISAMAMDGIKTYVIGYNTKSDPQLSGALDRMAQAGNTGDTQHRAIEDEQSLLAQFQQIAGVATSCELVLSSAPENPSYVDVRVDGNQVLLNDANGWTISADHKTVSLQGNACATLRSSAQHLVTVQVLCNPVSLQ